MGCTQFQKGTQTTEGTQADEGTIVGTITDWCEAGAHWTTTGAEGNAEFTVIGLATYKGKQMCHATYTATAGGETTKMDYYFTEEGEEACWVVADPTGEKTEWCGTG